MDLTYKLTDWILFDFRHDTDLQFSRLNMEFAIYQPKAFIDLLMDIHKSNNGSL